MQQFLTFIETIAWTQVALVGGAVILGYFLARGISYVIGRQVERRFDQTTGMVVRRLVFYGLLGLAVAIVLQELNISLGALLAAGGILGIALGFASQTAVSNIISGLFLIFERPFEVGTIIRVEGQLGMVESIDLLSTKVRTFDNLYWRMPNEKLLKSDIYNLTRYDIRRTDIKTSISYGDDIERAREVLLEAAEANPNVLGMPEPVTLVDNMGESGIELTLRFWFDRTDYLQVLSDLRQEVKVALEDAGCTIPFPHRTLYVRDEEEWREVEALNRERQSNPPADE